ncbi:MULTISPECIES: class I SAM-dependent methyltransferase [Pseudomonadota]|jgi:SAM-dependent methyltransferase|uniref:Methyltransferase family protein n=3 Tax=Burkholderiales TaxID=80840 RepID=A0A366H6H4_9BURK|nr:MULTISPECIES: class I SAM-dependent methyltransferase [Pseudomonadota]KRG85980.1 methyltransferase [Stenotrophomonas acidaminiphila]NZA01688.1 class I SAM-dependent methyltransferase [Ottowia beijingensis]OCX15369.1 methyltransferase [Stutzerimonas xanthomarina]OZA58879.1 MAG: SAM-dependent methyltransferase [Acidovorax sp. 17-64-282]QOG00004.1 class I SAM-dependent methyltransferase [Stenotrophomonas sp. CW117]HEC5273850.1 class I SAM-dependent methyltransferase [Enterobacter cloacae]HQS
MPSREHWDHVYRTKEPTGVSWFQPHASHSLVLIRETGVPLDVPIIDVGGGASTLVDDLLDKGHTSLTVLDLSGAALAASQARLGERAQAVAWMVGDITKVELPALAYDLWHDRAVFHFLTAPQERQAYVRTMLHALRPGGFAIIATFADDGPQQCSGLPVTRYSPDELHAQFGDAFTMLRQERQAHHTPFGTVQQFVFCLFQKTAS